MIRLTWQEAIGTLKTGDFLLCRPSSLLGLAIEHVTRSQYVHVAMAGWVYDEGWAPTLMQGETVGHQMARLIDLEGEVVRYPGFYDVYRPKLGFYKEKHGPNRAWFFMRLASGSCYGWGYIWAVWLRRRLGGWFPGPKNSDNPQTNRDCSGLAQAAVRYGGGKQLHPRDVDVVPADFADEENFEYIGTLFPDE